MSPQRAESHAQWDGSAVARCPVCGRPGNARHRGVSRRVDEPRVSRASGGGERHHGAIRCEFHAGRRRDQCLCRSELARSRSVAGRYRRLSLAAQRVLRRRRGYGGYDRCGRRTGTAPRRIHRARAATHGRQPALRYERSRSALGTQHARDEHVVRHNTRDAIERGCRVALAALVDRAFQELAARGTTPPALLGTGGAIEQIAPFINGPLAVVPELVLRGLATLAQART